MPKMDILRTTSFALELTGVQIAQVLFANILLDIGGKLDVGFTQVSVQYKRN